MANYRYLVADLLTNTFREEIPFEGVQYGEVLNAPGSFSGSVPLSLKRRATSSKAYRTTVTSDGPVGYWRLGEASGTTAADASGNARNGTYRNAPALAVNGLLVNDTNRGVTLKASSSQDVLVANNAAWSIGTTGKLSVEVLTSTTAGAGLLFAKSGEWEIGRIFSTYYVTLFNTTPGTFLQATAPDTRSALHIGFTYDGTTLTLYLDGVAVATASTPTGTLQATGANAVTIGSKLAATYWDGVVDEAAIYPTSLSAARMAAHSAAAAGNLETSTVSYDVVTRANLDPSRTAIYVERDDVLVWGGILWTAAADDAGYKLMVGAEGFWSYFRRRLLRVTKTYAAADQFFIARDFLNYAQGVSGGNIGVIVGSETCGVPRDRTYFHYERHNIAQRIEELAAVDNGFDFAIVVTYDGSGTPTKTFVPKYPKRGVRQNTSIDLGKNVESLTWNIDGSVQATAIDALGAGEGDAMLISPAADTSLTTYPLLEKSVQYKDVSVKATLDGHAATALRAYRKPVETLPNLVVRGSDDLDVGTFGTGDEIEVRTTNAGGFLAFDAVQRIMTWTVKVDENGKETISLSLANTEAVS